MLVEIVGQSFRTYTGPEKLLILLEGFVDEPVKRNFNILVRALEQSRFKPESDARQIADTC